MFSNLRGTKNNETGSSKLYLLLVRLLLDLGLFHLVCMYGSGAVVDWFIHCGEHRANSLFENVKYNKYKDTDKKGILNARYTLYEKCVLNGWNK